MRSRPSGAALIAAIFDDVAKGERATAARLADRIGCARSTIFAALRRLESAGLIDRTARGVVEPGPLLTGLGFARHGLGRIAATVEALIPALRDETEATVELVVETSVGTEILMRRSPPSRCREQDGSAATIDMPLAPERRDVILRLHPDVPMTRPQHDAMRRSVSAVADTLRERLRRAPGEGESNVA